MIDLFSLSIGLFAGVALNQVLSWPIFKSPEQESEKNPGEAKAALIEREAAIEEAMRKFADRRMKLEEMEKASACKMEEWKLKAKEWEAEISLREEQVDRREASARAEVERAKAALRGARARARRIISKFHASQGDNLR